MKKRINFSIVWLFISILMTLVIGMVVMTMVSIRIGLNIIDLYIKLFLIVHIFVFSLFMGIGVIIGKNIKKEDESI